MSGGKEITDMRYDRKITISAGANRRATQWTAQTLLVSDLWLKLKTPARGTETVTVVAEDTDSKKGSNALPIAVCGIAVIGGAGAFLYFRNKK